MDYISPSRPPRALSSTTTPQTLPTTTPPTIGFHTASPDRVNRDNPPPCSSFHDGAVSSKISQFNQLSEKAQASIERRYEKEERDREREREREAEIRKRREAKAKMAQVRAEVAREEVEGDLKRLREEVRTLRRKVEEGMDRERKLEERFEASMDKHSRTKETFAHTQELWEKELRRHRKDAWKVSSATVKLQEELKSARDSLKLSNEALAREKERSKAREQEAFTARYEIVGVQEELERALERIKVVEAERDSFRGLAKKEEVARLAAEGAVALPPPEPDDDEFATPRKRRAAEQPVPVTPMDKAMGMVGEKPVNKATDRVKRTHTNSRLSISTMDIVSSEASEMEIEELTRQVVWERQRADRAQEVLDFMRMECQLRCCPCIKELRAEEKRKQEEAERLYEEEEDKKQAAEMERLRREREQAEREVREISVEAEAQSPESPELPVPSSTVLSESTKASSPQMENDADFQEVVRSHDLDEAGPGLRYLESSDYHQPATIKRLDLISDAPPPPAKRSRREGFRGRGGDMDVDSLEFDRRETYPDPENSDERVSLMSLFDAPARTSSVVTLAEASFSIPTMPDSAASANTAYPEPEVGRSASAVTMTNFEEDSFVHAPVATVTTTKVPLRGDENSGFSEKARWEMSGRSMSGNSECSFDRGNPAMTPTMSREEALAKIRERRGRARSGGMAGVSAARTVSGVRSVRAGTARERREGSVSSVGSSNGSGVERIRVSGNTAGNGSGPRGPVIGGVSKVRR